MDFFEPIVSTCDITFEDMMNGFNPDAPICNFKSDEEIFGFNDIWSEIHFVEGGN